MYQNMDIYHLNQPEEKKDPRRRLRLILKIAIPAVIVIGAVLYFMLSAVPANLVIKDGTAEIPAYKYANSSGLISVEMPDSVVSIGEKAFYQCPNLSSVSLPSSLQTVGADAFGQCTGLASLVIPESVKEVGRKALNGCTALTDLTLPGDARYEPNFDYKAFPSGLTITGRSIQEGFLASLYERGMASASRKMRDSLERVTVAGSISVIPEEAFRSCTSLKTVELSDAVTAIENEAFAGCSALEELTIPDSVTKIGEKAFSWSGITNLDFLPGSLTAIEAETFANCSSLTAAVIPDSVVSIGDRAFSKCSKLESVSIPDSVEFIGEDVFMDCKALRMKVKDLFPTGFEDAVDVTQETGKLIPEGARVVPMGEYEDENLVHHKAWKIFDGKLYSLMPAEIRTADWFTADYAIILGWHSVRNENTTIITINIYGASVNSASSMVYDIYLCGRDGSVRKIGSSGSDSADRIWAAIADRF